MRALATTLALLCALAQAGAPPPPAPGTTAPAETPAAADPAVLIQNSKTMLDAEDLDDALATAEAAVAAGGGAAALAARGDAKRALGRPAAEALEDYRAAAEKDPRYAEKYDGLLAELRSQTRRDKSRNAAMTGAGGISMRFVGGLAAAGFVLLLLGLLFLRRKKSVGKSAGEL